MEDQLKSMGKNLRLSSPMATAKRIKIVFQA
jgi:hypothetical protein